MRLVSLHARDASLSFVEVERKVSKAIRWFIILFTLITALVVYPVQSSAQTATEPTGLKNVTMWIYPEYDDPRLLVMIEGKATGTSFPATIRFLVPQSAEMYSAGAKDSNGTYSGGPPNRQASEIDGWDEISYQLQYETFRVEYYYPAITGQPDKQISFDYHWLYPVADLRVVVQQPLKATNFSVTPAGVPGSEDQFNVMSYTYTNLGAGETSHYDIKYTKADSVPSMSTGAKSSAWWIWIVVVGVVLLGGILVISMGRSNRGRARPAPQSKRAPSQANSKGAKKPGKGNRFCNYCGKALDEGSNFCGECGKKVAK
jgi:predicted nucleic acid-binding Zn ribbon protein